MTLRQVACLLSPRGLFPHASCALFLPALRAQETPHWHPLPTDFPGSVASFRRWEWSVDPDMTPSALPWEVREAPPRGESLPRSKCKEPLSTLCLQ